MISAAAERVELAAGKAEATFTVTNNGPVDQRMVFDVVTADNADRSWFTVAQPQVLVKHGGSVTFLVAIAVPAGTAAGPTWFAGRAYSAEAAPEETAVVSDRVACEVGPSAVPPPWWKRWWWVFVVAALALVTLVVVLFLLLRGDDPDGPGAAPPDQTAPDQTAPDQTATNLVVRRTSELNIQATNPVDVDEIVQGAPSPASDIQFAASSSTGARFVQPANGATLAKIPATDRPGEQCARTALGNAQVGIDDWQVREVLCVRSGDGRLAVAVLRDKFVVAGRGPVLVMTVTTFERQP